MRVALCVLVSMLGDGAAHLIPCVMCPKDPDNHTCDGYGFISELSHESAILGFLVNQECDRGRSVLVCGMGHGAWALAQCMSEWCTGPCARRARHATTRTLPTESCRHISCNHE